MRNFTRLKVWQKAHKLVPDLYAVTNRFPVFGRFGLISQIRRAAVSGPANMAEGYGHEKDRRLVSYLRIPLSSSSEQSYHLVLRRDLKHIEPKGDKKHTNQLDEGCLVG